MAKIIRLATFCCMFPVMAIAQGALRPSVTAAPPVGEIAHATQGNSIYTETSRNEELDLVTRVQEPVIVDDAFTVTPVMELEREADGKSWRFCIDDKNKKVMGIRSPRRVCLYPGKDGRTFVAVSTRTIAAIAKTHRGSLDKPVSFASTDAVRGFAKGAFRRELMFSGAAGGTLRVLYREFVDDLARPAFSQELTYDLTSATPFMVNAKGVRLDVLRAGNDGIEYRVLKGFDDRP